MDHSLFRPLGLHLFMMHSEFGWNKWFWYFILVYPRISTFFLFVKPVFFWCILSVFSLGVPCFHQHDGPTQASGSCWLRGCVERSMCDSFGRGSMLTGAGLKNSEVKEAQKTKQIEGVMMWKKYWNIMVSFWFMRTCTNVYSSHVHFKICIVCGCVSESRAPPSALYMNLGRTPPDSVGFWLLRLGHLLFEDGWQVQWYL